jgi:hypothetical protein
MMESNMTDAQSKADKQPRFRSPPYPAIPLSKAIERVTALHAKALHHSVPVAVPASAWDYAEKSSGLFATIAALKQFGLIVDEGNGDKRRFKLSDTALRIVRDPDPTSTKRLDAIRAAALKPKIHSALWERYGVAGASGAMDVAMKSFLTVDRHDDGEAPYSPSAADDLIAEYRQTIAFAGIMEPINISSEEEYEQEAANLEVPKEPITSINPQSGQSGVMRSAPPQQFSKEEELNDIRLEFFGGKVRINALMDKSGLEELEKKIAAFKAIMS